MKNFDLQEFLIMMAALIICITIHEFAHAYSAYRAGDDTPKHQNRLSLNPLDHLDPVGTFMILASSLSGFGIGWGKPVMVNPANFKHPRWDNLRVSLWGPLSNILTAIAAGAAFRLVGYGMGRGWIHYSVAMGNVYDFLGLLTLISIGLAIFNLIPIAPLDGSHIISSLLPIERARRYDMFMGRYGMLIFIALILMGTGGHGPDILGMILDPPRRFLWALLAGGLH